MSKHPFTPLVRVEENPSVSSCRSGVCRKITISCWMGLAVFLAAPTDASMELMQYSMEELMNMEVTSASKKSQALSEAATAIHVITQEDIRRSGLTSIPELLRLVPGLQVARVDANKWAISSRGFNSLRANKLLVLLDGRTLYTPLFSGVYWNVQDTPLEDIERIEVIRGPGGTLWGANAVLGVINIITKRSGDTQGGWVAARAGDHEKDVTLRYGDALGNGAEFRAYAKINDDDAFVDSEGEDAYDDWSHRQAGFRADFATSSQDELTLQGDLYEGEFKQQVAALEDVTSANLFGNDRAKVSGGNLLFRWHRRLAEDADWEFQAYYDHTKRDELNLSQRVDTLDLDFQHRFPLSVIQEITWGFNYRYISDWAEGTFAVTLDPEEWDQELYSAFIQDEIQLSQNLQLSLGSKLEHNDFTGFEYQPSVRLLWQLTEQQSLWGAVSRAVRTPSRVERDARLNVASFSSPYFDPDGNGPLEPGDYTLISVFGSKEFESEEMLAYELGYRSQLQPHLSLDGAVFYNQFDNLLTSESGEPYAEGEPPTNAVMPTSFANNMDGESYGLELAINWQLSSDWRLRTSYTWLRLAMELTSTSTDTTHVALAEESSPRHQFQLHSFWNLRHDMEVDTAIYHVDSVVVGEDEIPAYTRLDLRLGWRPTESLELSVAGQNLLDDRHPEFYNRDSTNSEVPRTLYARMTIRY